MFACMEWSALHTAIATLCSYLLMFACMEWPSLHAVIATHCSNLLKFACMECSTLHTVTSYTLELPNACMECSTLHTAIATLCSYLLVMTFKPQRRVNTALANECSTPVVRQKCTYGNMAESKLLCVRVATLLESNMQAY